MDMYICDDFGRRRSVGEVQLMHNLREHKQVQERLEWLHRRLQGMNTLGLNNKNNNNNKSGWGRKGIVFREQPNLRDLTQEEIQYAIKALEKLLKSPQ